MPTRKLCTIILIAGTMLLAACGTTPPTRFYTLSAEAPLYAGESKSRDVVIGIGPTEVAPYLERSQIVTRSGQTRLKLTEFDRWAEPVENNIANVLAVNLSRLLPTAQPIVRPWSDAGAEYHVLLKVQRFDSDPEGNVQLNASWGIQLSSAHTMPLIRDAAISQPSAGTDYEAITKNMSTALATLSEEIAVELAKLISDPSR